MEAVRTWAFSVCAGVAACGIALQIMPRSSLTQIFKLVVSVFFLCCLLSPVLLSMPAEQYVFESYRAEIAEEKAAALKAIMEKQTIKNAEQALKKNIEDKLNQMGINYHEVAININTNGQSAGVAVITLDKSFEPGLGAIEKELEAHVSMDVDMALG